VASSTIESHGFKSLINDTSDYIFILLFIGKKSYSTFVRLQSSKSHEGEQNYRHLNHQLYLTKFVGILHSQHCALSKEHILHITF